MLALAIGAILLTLIYSIGDRAARSGLRLGGRAQGEFDGQLGEAATRTILQSLQIPPTSATVQTSFDGAGDSVTAVASLPRPTPCGGPGPVGVMRLSVRQDGTRWIVACQTTSPARAANLMIFVNRPAGFSYSIDGSTWTSSVHLSSAAQAAPPPGAPAAGPPPRRRVIVRLATADGASQMIEMLSAPPAQQAQAAS